MIKTGVCFILFLLAKVSLGQTVFTINDEIKEYLLKGQEYQVLIDEEGSITSTTILLHANQKKFLDYPFKDPSNQKQGAHYWAKCSLISSGVNKFWYLELVDPHIQNIEIYEVIGGELVKKGTNHGFSFPFSSKPIFYKNYLYKIDLSDNKIHHYYFKFNSSHINYIGLKIRSPEFIISYTVSEYFILGLFYGILLIMALYNTFIFFSVKEKIYLVYVLYVIVCALNSFQEDGLGFQFFWPNMPGFNIFLVEYAQLLLLVIFAIYASYFLNIKKLHPGYAFMLLGLIGLNFIVFFINAVWFKYTLNIQLSYLMTYTYIYSLVFYLWRKGYKSARFFIIGYSVIYFSFIVFYLRTLGYDFLFYHLLTIYIFNIGIVLEVVILSYALSERLREEKNEKEIAQNAIIDELKSKEILKDKLNKELEIKVEERTLALSVANEKINDLNRFLERKNIKLEEDVKQISKERVMQKELSLEEFKQTYPSEDSCYKYLAELKWGGSFVCKKCKNEKFSSMPKEARRCTKCKYIESVTAFTIFHSLKFSILEAFYVLFLVSIRKEITPEELSKTIQLSEKSCLNFKKKIIQAEKAMKGKHRDKSGWERLILQ